MKHLSQGLLAVVTVAGLSVLPSVAAGQDAPRKLIAPVRGEATIDHTLPATKPGAKEVVTTITIKNTSGGAIAGFRVDETWYDKAGNPMGGDTYRHPKPLLADAVIVITLRTPRRPGMMQNQYQFTHANGTIKPNRVPKIEVPKTSS